MAQEGATRFSVRSFGYALFCYWGRIMKRQKILHYYEVKLYRFLGVKQFQKLVFKLEKFIHRKDGEKNTNYHFSSIGQSAVEAFYKFLFFNGGIHVRNLVFFAVYIILRVIFGKSINLFDILFSLLAVKDIYCVMLQRYNFIRIKATIATLQRKASKKINHQICLNTESFYQNYDESYIDEDLSYIQNFIRRIEAGEDIFIEKADYSRLVRLRNAYYGGINKK